MPDHPPTSHPAFDPDAELRCLGCYYPLMGLKSNKCPECSRPFDFRDPTSYTLEPPFPFWTFWLPGFELAVSDLSQRGRSVGFPHMFRYVLSERRPRGHSLLYEVRGVWTSRWVPRLIVRLRLAWVMAATRGRLLAHLARQRPL